MFSGIFKQLDYGTWLRSLLGNRAVDKGKTECIRCGYCCATRPCIPRPDELEQVAEYLKMSIPEMLNKFFVVDKYDRYGTLFLFPGKSTQLDLGGKYVPWERTYDEGYCVFFDEKQHMCKIHPARPEMAKAVECWRNSDEKHRAEEQAILDSVMKAWRGVDVEKLVGHRIETYDDEDRNGP